MTRFLAEMIFLAGVVAWGAIRIPHEIRNKRKNKIEVSSVDRQERVLLLISLAGLGMIPIAYCLTRRLGFLRFADFDFSPAAAWLGALIFVAALALFLATHRQLGRNWSQTLELREGHTLVTHGVYRLVRHPMYSAFFLWGLAQLLLLQNLIVGPAGLIGFGTLYCFRIAREERMMHEAFGQHYAEYADRTKRIIPFVH
ncbi:isoprenylcysteine carboxylmethyltransferase family protein [Phreatobacter aquaticus]|uniref:Isoprenylcysteine carboxylmethyltransferase family protein n=1 Tax=Phreatobacter aquaticus TaxID=2570229 RepID=A0A4D7QQX4_9HYPH|nr:protein-S-isoprenylcysteine O-methyltransferase [Phreatobacter aquaticus]QCK88393.1 isoprenylcysteine carboxylmethyltransferase family protein [Phreatobacter aquaticus]